MATGADGVILQPLWKIHNIDWSDRRNVFETEPSSPGLGHLLRGSYYYSRYDFEGPARVQDRNDNFRDCSRFLCDYYDGYRPPLFHKWPPNLTAAGRTSA